MAVTNQKGGTGKTTSCENLGAGLVMAGKRVLLVDTDPQASLTVALGHPRADDLPVTLTDLMTKIIQDQPIDPGEGILRHPEGMGFALANERFITGYFTHSFSKPSIFKPLNKSFLPQK